MQSELRILGLQIVLVFLGLLLMLIFRPAWLLWYLLISAVSAFYSYRQIDKQTAENNRNATTDAERNYNELGRRMGYVIMPLLWPAVLFYLLKSKILKK